MRNQLLVLLFFYSLQFFGQSITHVKVQENRRTKTSFVLNLIKTKPGALLDSVQIESDVRRLKRMAGIAHAYFKVITNPDGSYDVVFGIQDNFTLIPQANIYTTNNDEFAFRLGLYEYNFLGRNIALGGFYQDDIFSSYGFNFRAPNLFSASFGLAFNFQDLTTQEPVFLDDGIANYRYNNTSFEVLGLYQINFNNSLSLGVSLFNEDYLYIDGVTSPDVPRDFDVNKTLFKAIYDFTDVSYYYHYRDGFKSILNLQYVTSLEEILPDFVIGWNDFIYYKRVGKKGNWASRLRLGLASNDDSPFAPFAVDNNLNVRGVGNIIDRGTGVIVLNTEYRHTLIDKNWFVLQSNVFVDSGTWRNPGGDFGDIRVYPGIGLRFIHKQIFNAVFRIDYGYGITPDATRGFVFGIGQYF